MIELAKCRKVIDTNLASYRLAKQQVEEETNRLEQAKQEVEDCLQAQKILQSAAETIQGNACKQISKVVSRCLQAVFGEYAYKFEIDFKQARGKTEAQFWFVDKHDNKIDPLEASGGGCVDVASFALRMVKIVLTKSRRFLACDEPFKFVNGEEYQSRVAELIEELAEEMQMQFVFVSDDDWLKIGKVVQIGED